MTTCEHLKRFQLIHYIRIVAFLFDSFKIFIHDETIFIRYNFIIKFLTFIIYIIEK